VSEYQYTVRVFYDDGWHHHDGRWLDLPTALTQATRISGSAGARLGRIGRIIIIDGTEETVWEWTRGRGVTFSAPA
jgi:hypothetical protein